MRILVRPFYSDYLQNRLFEPRHEYATHWMEPLVKLREAVVACGWEIETWDMQPLDSADIVLMLDLPQTREEVLQARRKAPNARFMLILWETPLSRPHFFDRRNHDLFDAIITYDSNLVDDKRYFKFYLPLGIPSQAIDNPPFEARRPMVMINTNRWIGVWARRQRGLAGLPWIGAGLAGWKVSPAALLGQNTGELYSRRRRLARLADREFPGLLDVYGPGWRGEPMSWVHRFIAHRPFACGKGEFKGQKFELIPRYRFVLAFENMVGNKGYISEKLFDAIYGGSVPLYLGDTGITELVPSDAMVDCRQFNSDRQLLEFARDCGNCKWEELIAAGKRYLASPQAELFRTSFFVSRILEILGRVGEAKQQ
jgi:hypothetical protein